MTTLQPINPISTSKLKELILLNLKAEFTDGRMQNELCLNTQTQLYYIYFYKPGPGYAPHLSVNTPNGRIFDTTVSENLTNWEKKVSLCAKLLSIYLNKINSSLMNASLFVCDGRTNGLETPVLLQQEHFPVYSYLPDNAGPNIGLAEKFAAALADGICEEPACTTFVLHTDRPAMDILIYSKRDGRFEISSATETPKHFAKDKKDLQKYLFNYPQSRLWDCSCPEVRAAGHNPEPPSFMTGRVPAC